MLLLNEPEAAALSCDECQRWVYDFKKKRWSMSFGNRVARPVGSKPPCWNCPKCAGIAAASPAIGAKSELSERNLRALQAYYDNEPCDDLTRRVFGIIRRTIEAHGRQVTRNILELLAAPRL